MPTELENGHGLVVERGMKPVDDVSRRRVC
jgi:hypothetical protein